MRAETVQYGAPEERVFKWARWAGIGLLFYAGLNALDGLDFYTRFDGGIWLLIESLLPRVAMALVLLFSAEVMTPSGSRAPSRLAAGLILVSLGLAVRELLADPAATSEAGFWPAVRVFLGVNLPLKVLLLLLVRWSDVRLREVMPLVAVVFGVAYVLLAEAEGIHGLSQFDSTGFWFGANWLIPAEGFAFALVVAAIYRLERVRARQAAIVFTGVMLLNAVTVVVAALQMEQTVSSTIEWSTASRVIALASQAVLILAFAGLLTRRTAYRAAVAGVLATAITAWGLANEVGAAGGAAFWSFTLPVVSVGSTLLLAMVAVELQRERERLASAPSYGDGRRGRGFE